MIYCVHKIKYFINIYQWRYSVVKIHILPRFDNLSIAVVCVLKNLFMITNNRVYKLFVDRLKQSVGI